MDIVNMVSAVDHAMIQLFVKKKIVACPAAQEDTHVRVNFINHLDDVNSAPTVNINI